MTYTEKAEKRLCPTCGRPFKLGASYGSRNGERLHIHCITALETRDQPVLTRVH